jgi:serine/threonine protein kinase/ankyrin repeat protein/Ca2+-binding EF-hand superfamily protein
VDRVAVELLYSKFVFLTQPESVITKKEFLRFFRSAGDKLAALFWSVLCKTPNATTIDFIEYVEFVAAHGRKSPLPLEKRAALAYELLDLGGQQNVSKDDMDRVLRALSKAHGHWVAQFDARAAAALAERFWLGANLKVANLAEFTAAVLKADEPVRLAVADAFGIVPVLLEHVCPHTTSKLLCDPSVRRAIPMISLLGNKKFVIHDGTLAEFRRADDTEPVRKVDLSEVELEHSGSSGNTIVITQMHDDGRPLNGAPPTNRIKLEFESALEWIDSILSHAVGLMHRAVVRRDLAALRLLVQLPDAEAQLQRLDLSGSTPLNSALKLARSADEREIVDELLAAAKRLRGAGANVPDGNGWTPLHYAAQCQSDDVTRMLLALPHVSCNARNNDGGTPLHYYCQYATSPQCIDTLTLFLNSGSDINATNLFGEAPLHKAVFNSQVRTFVMEWLLKNGANVDAQTKITDQRGGDTALHYAIHLQRTDIVRILLVNGASLKIPNAKQQTALTVARKDSDIYNLLQDARRLDKYLGDPKLKMAHYARLFLAHRLKLENLPELGDKGFQRVGIKKLKDRKLLLRVVPYLGEQLALRRSANSSSAGARSGGASQLATASTLSPQTAAQLYQSTPSILRQSSETGTGASKIAMPASKSDDTVGAKATAAVAAAAAAAAAAASASASAGAAAATTATTAAAAPGVQVRSGSGPARSTGGDVVSAATASESQTALPSFNSQTTPEIDESMVTLRKQLGAMRNKAAARELDAKDVEFTEELGRGTSGTVFKGLLKLPDQAQPVPAAIKILKASTSANEIREFRTELEILMAVESPYLVRFYGWQLRPTMLMVMELCENGSLHDVLNKKRLPIEWSHVLQWALEAALGVMALHGDEKKKAAGEPVKPIVHRDLKSLNLLLTKEYRVKVCDFGLSRHASNSNMETLGKLRGTMAYAAPEAYLGEEFTVKADVYSFGIILWEIAARMIKQRYERPFEEYPHLIMDFQVIIQVAKNNLRPTTPPTTPPSLAALIADCTKQDRVLRPEMHECAARIKLMQREYDAAPDKWKAAIVGQPKGRVETTGSSEDSSSDSDSSDSSDSSSSSSSSSASSSSSSTSSSGL